MKCGNSWALFCFTASWVYYFDQCKVETILLLWRLLTSVAVLTTLLNIFFRICLCNLTGGKLSLKDRGKSMYKLWVEGRKKGITCKT